ncbi:MAG TPA: glucans biosynthesis glucosyltransferase MdoH [Verrucomicrobiae bacterium]|nr:glucans biosynthesis glucosyltransferase MdoH [Verrucomicrobiae bacterium]
MKLGCASPGRSRIQCRRFALGILTALTMGAASYGMLRLLLVNGFQPLEWFILPLFVILVLPIALSFWTAVFGFVIQLFGEDELSLSRSKVDLAAIDLHAFRSAIVIPAYNEDAIRLFAGLKATYQSVQQAGLLSHFDFFLLSDTTDVDTWIREEMAFDDLRHEVSDPERLFYRNRRQNVERKAGNIADFCATWGGNYRYMVVFDADSLMSGKSLGDLVRLMEAHPRIGILQTPPVAVNRQSLFGRVLQFATRAYGPMFIKGLNYWQAGESNYWGHNAIIRIQPFVEHCRLPKLPGKEPLGGSILSHDFVEAALMRRAGWKVYLVTELGGSYEEVPASLVGHAARDRRWCQGNLQHARLLTMPGLNWISRIHLAMGVMAYAASPLWMLMLFLSTAEGLRVAFGRHNYFPSPHSPFPVWHVSAATEAILLFSSVLSLLLLPKILSLVSWWIKQRSAMAGFGGPAKMTLSIVAEILFSILVAPVLAIIHSRFVLGTLLGSNVKWSAQDRGDVATDWSTALRWHLGLGLFGVVWLVLLWTKDPALLRWLAPVLIGWLLAIPFSVWTSRVAGGQWARRHGLFLTPEEMSPPSILRDFHEALSSASSRPWATARDGLDWVLKEPHVRSVHLSLLPSKASPADTLARHRLEGLRLKLRAHGEAALRPEEKRELLWDADSIESLKQA